jgi:nucleoside-diphosphate-sugar epimerase
MKKAPIFPIPGDGRYIRQPIYVRDFCRVIDVCMTRQPSNAIYDLVGSESIYYVDMIREVKAALGVSTTILPIPISTFRAVLRAFGWFMKDPPFTSAQLTALTVGDQFDGVDMRQEFGVSPTRFIDGIRETFGPVTAKKKPPQVLPMVGGHA